MNLSSFMAISKACVFVHTSLFLQNPNGHLKSNILIDDDGNARLADFGLSRVLEKTGLTTKSIAGSCRWMPYELMYSDDPEQDGTFTTASDVWSLGMTILEVCDKQSPPGNLTHYYCKRLFLGGHLSRSTDTIRVLYWRCSLISDPNAQVTSNPQKWIPFGISYKAYGTKKKHRKRGRQLLVFPLHWTFCTP